MIHTKDFQFDKKHLIGKKGFTILFNALIKHKDLNCEKRNASSNFEVVRTKA